MCFVLSKNGVYEIELNHYPCCCTLDIDVDQAGLSSAFRDDGFHLPCDIKKAVMGRGAYLNGLLHKLYLTFMVKLSNLSNE